MGSEDTFDVKATSMSMPEDYWMLALIAVGGKPIAVRIDRLNNKLQRVALDSGTVTELGDTKDIIASYSYRATAGVAPGSLIVASSPRFDSSSDPVVQPLRIETYCTAGW